MKAIRIRVLLSLRIACVLLFATSAFAQNDICFPGAGGLAGTPVIDGIVDGYTGPGPINNDAGWNGATRWNLSVNNGTPVGTKFQSGRSGNSLYFSWVIDEPVYGESNTIVLGMANTGAAANTNWLIFITPFDVIPAPDAANLVPTSILFWRNSAGDAWRNDVAQGGAGTWLETNTRVSRTGNRWAVEMRVPISTTLADAPSTNAVYLPSSGAFKFYTNVLVTYDFSPMTVVQDPWPAGVIVPGGNTLQANMPSVASWGNASLNQRPECTGVSIAWADIGVEKPEGSETIVQQIERYSGAIAEGTIAQCNALPANANIGTRGPKNVFIARPLNNMTGAANQVSATFRIANWGISAPHEFDVLGVPVPPFPAPVRPNPTTPSAPIAQNTKAVLRSDWALSYKQSCQFKFMPHQCIQADLDSPDPGTRFTRKSVQKNMDFVPLSRFERRARISGEFDAGTEKLDMLLLIRTDEQVTRGGSIPRKWKRASTSQSMSFGNDELVDATRGMTGVTQLAWMADAILRLADDQTLIIGERRFRLGRRIGGFGYVASHAGDFDDFDWTLKGEDIQPTENPNVYRVVVPFKGETFVDTMIQTIGSDDRDPQPEPSGGDESDLASGGGRWGIFFDAGNNFPHGDLSNAADGEYSFNFGLERLLSNTWSIEGILGYHSFDVPLLDARIWQLSVNAKRFFPGGSPLTPFINGGVGAYRFEPGDDETDFGWNAGAGLLYLLGSNWGVEGVANFHSVNSEGDSAQWTSVQLGLRKRF